MRVQKVLLRYFLTAAFAVIFAASSALGVPVVLDPGFEPSATNYDVFPDDGSISCADSMTGEPCNMGGTAPWVWWVGPAPTSVGNTGLVGQGNGQLTVDGGFGDPNVFGSQAAFIQSTPADDSFATAGAELSQMVSGFEINTQYEVSFQTRLRFSAGNDLTVTVGGQTVLSELLAGGNSILFDQRTTSPFTATAETMELKFRTEGGVSNSVFLDDVVIDTLGVGPTESTWNSSGTGDWNTAVNWAGGVPNVNTKTATLGSIISSPATVTVDAPVTVGGITFENSNTYAIAGTSSVTLEANTGDAALTVNDGDHQFQLPVILNDDTVVDVAAGSSLSFNNQLNLGGNTLTKSGEGSLFINNQLTPGGGTVMGNSGVIGGSGTVGGDIINNGILAPGLDSGILVVQGDVVFGDDAVIVPEPMSLALIGLGLMGLGALAGRRRKSIKT